MPKRQPYAERRFIGKPQQETARNYRELVARAITIAQQYDGTEDKYNQLMQALGAWESAIEEFGFSGNRIGQETEAALIYTDDHLRDLNSVLDIAIKARQKALEIDLELHDNDRPFVLAQHEGIFLRPDSTDNPVQPGDGEGIEVRFDQIIDEFLGLVEKNGIFADDLIITRGKEPKRRMMRQESYVKFEIPRLGKTVLLCPQVGEATFIVQGNIANETLCKLSKWQLEHSSDHKVRRAIRGNRWEEDVIKYLFDEKSWEADAVRKTERKEVDVHKMYEERGNLVQRVRDSIGPGEWSEFSNREAAARLNAIGVGIERLASVVGLAGDAREHKIDRLILGLLIWPENEFIKKALIAEKRTPEEWKERIREVSTPEEILNLKPSGSDGFNIDCQGLHLLVRKFGIDGDPLRDRKVRTQFVITIWPESEAAQKAHEVARRTVEDWRLVLQKEYLPERFINMPIVESRKLFDGYTFTTLAPILGVENFDCGKTESILRFGLAVWPNNELLTRYLEAWRRGPGEWKTYLRGTMTPEDWIGRIGKRGAGKDDLVFDGISLRTIGKEMGVNGDPLENNLSFLEMGALIWPESSAMQAAWQTAQEKRRAGKNIAKV